jgi:hypothetical protein
MPHHAVTEHPSPPTVHASPDDPTVPMPRRFSNRSIVLTILTVMVTMGVVGFGLAWETIEWRRGNDLHLTKPAFFGIPAIIKVVAGLWLVGLVLLLMGFWRKRAAGEAAPTARTRWITGLGICAAVLSTMMILFSGPIRRRNSQHPPELDRAPIRTLEASKLEGLRYLPVDTNIVAGIHVAELMQEPKSREFLDGLRIAALHFNADRLERWTGLERANIEYVLLGLKIEDQLMPRTTVIARSLAPFDVEALRQKLHGVPSAEDPNRFHFNVVGTKLEAEARAIPAERLLIVGLTRADLEAVPAQPHAGLDALNPRLGALLRTRLDRSARLWAVGQVSDWGRTPVIWWLNQQPESDRKALETIRGFAAGVLVQDPLVVRAEIETEDRDTAHAVASYLERLRGDAATQLTIPPPRDGWVSVQARMKARAVQEAFQAK